MVRNDLNQNPLDMRFRFGREPCSRSGTRIVKFFERNLEHTYRREEILKRSDLANVMERARVAVSSTKILFGKIPSTFCHLVSKSIVPGRCATMPLDPTQSKW